MSGRHVDDSSPAGSGTGFETVNADDPDATRVRAAPSTAWPVLPQGANALPREIPGDAQRSAGFRGGEPGPANAPSLEEWPGSLDAVPPFEPTRDGAYSPPTTGNPATEPSTVEDQRPSRKRWQAALAITLALVLLTGAAAYFIRLVPARNPGNPAEGAVDFLRAVAAGNANAALALQEEVPADRTLLTDDVLRASLDRAPISDIRVARAGPDEVELAYRLNTRPVTASFVPVRQADGTFKVRTGTTTVHISLPKQVPVLINGQRVSSTQVQAFPGSYELDTGLTHLQFAERDFTVSGPRSDPRVAPATELSDAGTRAFRSAVRNQLTACLEASELNPPGCPQHVREQANQQPDESTIRWTLVSDPFEGASPRLNLEDETVAEMRMSVRMHLSASMLQDGQPGTVDQSWIFATTVTGHVARDPVSVSFVNS